MWQQVATTVFALTMTALAGCTLVYNPSNLPDQKKDAGVADAEVPIDADPTMLTLERVVPSVIFEGTGTGGSRRVIVTIHATNLIPDATVEIVAAGAGAPKLTVDNSLMDRVAENGRMIAVPVTLMVDPALAQDAQIPLKVRVTQPVAGGMKVAELDTVEGSPALVLKGLPELVSATSTSVTGGDLVFSQVMVTGDLVAMGSAPLRIQSMSSINVTGTVRASASGMTGVAGGADGGAGGFQGVGGTGGPGGDAGPNTGGGEPSGGGGGHAEKGGGAMTGGAPYGTPSMTTIYGGSGGAGGDGSTLASGGAGGGGGGVIELSAHGNLSVNVVESVGGAGANVTNADDGGGGAGGSVLLRSQATLAVMGAVNVSGGMGQNMGAPGRTRYDAAMGPGTLGAAYRGPMFHPSAPLITRSESITLQVTGKPLEQFKYFFQNENGSMIEGPFDAAFAEGGTNSITLDGLYRGSNTVCLLVADAPLSNTNREARNCIQLVYLQRFAQ